MKKLFALFVLLAGCSTSILAQHADTIAIINKHHDYTYQLRGSQLGLHRLKEALKPDPAAFRIYHNARAQLVWSAALEGAGIGLAVGNAVDAWEGVGKINPVLIGAGLATAAIAIHFEIRSDRKILKAVRRYNEDVQKTSFKPSLRPEYSVLFTGGRVGLSVKF